MLPCDSKCFEDYWENLKSLALIKKKKLYSFFFFLEMLMPIQVRYFTTLESENLITIHAFLQ